MNNNIPIPTKLIFGDENQIKLIRDAEKKFQKEQEEKERGVKKYIVSWDVYDSGEIEVEASSEQEAREIALEELDVNDIDFHITVKSK